MALEEVPQFEESCLYLGPGGIGSVTKHSALFLILLADDCCEFWGREKRIAVGETHAFREEIALGKMRSANALADKPQTQCDRAGVGRCSFCSLPPEPLVIPPEAQRSTPVLFDLYSRG